MRTLFQQISEILHNDWDPIGVRDEHATQDEYDSYIPSIMHMLHERASMEKIKEYLLKIETEEIGLPPNYPRALNTAARLAELAIL